MRKTILLSVFALGALTINAQTAVVADFYRAQGKFESVPSMGAIEEVAERIAAVVEKYL